ncbi:similar to Saccharomyces cerevisiae YKL191W DPH2 Protein required [Maudiozyma saulgeensis]|uniref:2-(3-amino-3-carboxypropyl)histidine synthase subunit 2 n=1 Tax=Maudiozyma saulgeensis TaxID=1789683 RepID=A0A1X7QZ98_9SACH|nr:similar to Saccharomyces cerevisiae YKL191W DPH2 Protein required [Kazachstania saulgeensis]
MNVPLPVSTQQTEQDFSFQRFDTKNVERSAYLGSYTQANLLDKLSAFYSLDELSEYLLTHPQYGKVTLQFPDSLVMDSSFVIKIIEEQLNKKDPENKRRLWVLADTAYSSCCVDEVAAEHVNADLVIHFGDACLNAIQKLPVVYSFGKPYLNLESLITKFKENFPDINSKVCLIANSPFTYYIKQIYDELKSSGYNNLIYSTVNKDLINDNVTILSQDFESDQTNFIYTLRNRMLYSDSNTYSEDKEKSIEDQLKEDVTLFYISVPQDPHLLYLTTMFNDVAIYDNTADSISNGPFPSLMKRYKYMHVARTAGCIGVLVNTLSLRNTKETINKLTQLIKQNGKKHYLFVVGKPNVAKLANFDPVDIWCILGCGQSGIIVDQFNEFYKPIITPYELTMALNQEVTWTGKWVTDFEAALKDVEEELANGGDEDGTLKEESDIPEFDAVTGRLLDTSRPLRNLKHLELEGPTSGDKTLAKRVSGGTIIKGTVSTSVAHLQSRHWSGLGSDFQGDEEYEEEGATIEEGITGVARGYGFDRHDAQSKQ